MRHPSYILATAVCAILMAGCASFDPAKERATQTDAFRKSLAEKAQSLLAQPVSLADCLNISLTNNYDIRLAELDRTLGKFDVDAAFSAFLPQVSASVHYNAYKKNPVVSSRRFEQGGIDAGMAIFMPSTWFLYAEAKHAREAAALRTDYVRQAIVLQTTSDFYSLYVQEDLIKAYEAQVTAAQHTADRISGLAKEGLARPWEADQAMQLLAARQTQLASAKRELDVLRGNLLATMGLSPLSPLSLIREPDQPIPELDSVESLVLKTLSQHPSLSIADRQVVISENEVRKAFCAFIPTLSTFGSWTFSGNDIQNTPYNNLLGGFQATYNLFSGFSNLANYRASKTKREQAKLSREYTFLSIMTGVVSARAAVLDATENAALARAAYEVAQAKASDLDARAREGLVPLHEALDAEAERDLAQTDAVRAGYGARIALANLHYAMGDAVPANPEQEQ